jgi:hypothetical protein
MKYELAIKKETRVGNTYVAIIGVSLLSVLLTLTGCAAMLNSDAADGGGSSGGGGAVTVSYPLRAATDGVFGVSTDRNPAIDNVETRLRSLVGPSDYKHAVGNTAYLDGATDHWQGIAMSHLDPNTLYLSRSQKNDHQTFNYAHLDGYGDPWFLLEYEDGTEPAYYHDLHGAQDHGNHIQAIGGYLLFSHLDLGNAAAHTYLEILDLTTDQPYGSVFVKPSLRSIPLTAAGFVDVDYIGNAGIAALDTGHYLIVDTVYTKDPAGALNDFLGFQVYLSDSTDIAGSYSHMWSLTLDKIVFAATELRAFAADNNVRYQGVDVIAQTDGTIFLAATRPEAVDLYEFVAESESIDDVQANLVAQIGLFEANETDAFRYGGSVMVWQESDGLPSIRVMCIESADDDNIPWGTHSYFEIWTRI